METERCFSLTMAQAKTSLYKSYKTERKIFTTSVQREIPLRSQIYNATVSEWRLVSSVDNFKIFVKRINYFRNGEANPYPQFGTDDAVCNFLSQVVYCPCPNTNILSYQNCPLGSSDMIEYSCTSLKLALNHISVCEVWNVLNENFKFLNLKNLKHFLNVLNNECFKFCYLKSMSPIAQCMYIVYIYVGLKVFQYEPCPWDMASCRRPTSELTSSILYTLVFSKNVDVSI